MIRITRFIAKLNENVLCSAGNKNQQSDVLVAILNAIIRHEKETLNIAGESIRADLIEYTGVFVSIGGHHFTVHYSINGVNDILSIQCEDITDTYLCIDSNADSKIREERLALGIPLIGLGRKSALILEYKNFLMQCQKNEQACSIKIEGEVKNASEFEIRDVFIVMSIGNDQKRMKVLQKGIIHSLDSMAFSDFTVNLDSDTYSLDIINGISDKTGIKYAPLIISQIIDRLTNSDEKDSVYIELHGKDKNGTNFESIYKLNTHNGIHSLQFVLFNKYFFPDTLDE